MVVFNRSRMDGSNTNGTEAEPGLELAVNSERVAILDAGAQYGKVRIKLQHLLS